MGRLQRKRAAESFAGAIGKSLLLRLGRQGFLREKGLQEEKGVCLNKH